MTSLRTGALGAWFRRAPERCGKPLLWLFAAALCGCSQQAPEAEPEIPLARLLAGDDAGVFARVIPGVGLTFPDDHGAHPGYQHEWWYLSGNLRGEGQTFGFQWTLFRFALGPHAPTDNGSRWRTSQVYMAHLALTDVTGGSHRAAERFSRGALGLAGVSSRPFRAHLEDWRLETASGVERKQLFPARLTATGRDALGPFGLSLTVENRKPLVEHGVDGYSAKDAEGSSASYYYSYPRLAIAGEVSVGGDSIAVQGQGWLDREWSSRFMDTRISGWDWFALQFDSGRELMLFQTRGAADFMSGTLIERDGEPIPLTMAELRLRGGDPWRSPTGRDYPLVWQVEVPEHELALEVTAKFPASEMPLAITYWEGPVTVTGSERGEGYMELTGYSGGTKRDRR